MKVKILSWNVRGVSDPDKRKLIKNFLITHKVDRFLNWKALNAEGTARGILLLWDKRRISLVDSVVGSFSVLCLFRMAEDMYQWVFSRVYGSIERSLRESFWEELGSISGLWEEPWCVGDDFNEILSPNERSRGSMISNTMRRFSNVLNDLGLRDFRYREVLKLVEGGERHKMVDQCPV